MKTLATEFPIRSVLNGAQFVAHVISWLRGTRYSKVLDLCDVRDLDGDAAHVSSRNGEELKIRQLGDRNNFDAIGFRYDFNDNNGRLWRTEAVLRRKPQNSDQDIIRLSTKCIAVTPGARIELPRKPYLIKNYLRDDLGGIDEYFSVIDTPHWLSESDEDLQLARLSTLGKASHYLPMVYFSAVERGQWVVSREKIERFSFEVGGIAHVLVEPSRPFSFNLRDISNGENAYGGAIAVIAPYRGIVHRAYLGLRFSDSDELLSFVREKVLALRSQMPAEGWDWTDLQEQALRRQREMERNHLSAEESERLYVEEIENLKDIIEQMKEKLENNSNNQATETSEDSIYSLISNKEIAEIYPGELNDRIRFAESKCIERSEILDLDPRSLSIFEALVKNVEPSPALKELIEDLQRTTKDSKRIASELSSLLRRHGYDQKSDNKHMRLEPRDGYRGLGTITLSKTPSDNRSLQNIRKQVERTLGITNLNK